MFVIVMEKVEWWVLSNEEWRRRIGTDLYGLGWSTDRFVMYFLIERIIINAIMTLEADTYFQ